MKFLRNLESYEYVPHEKLPVSRKKETKEKIKKTGIYQFKQLGLQIRMNFLAIKTMNN